MGKFVGTVSSAGYGYSVNKTIALGYIPADLSRELRRTRSLHSARAIRPLAPLEVCTTRMGYV